MSANADVQAGDGPPARAEAAPARRLILDGLGEVRWGVAATMALSLAAAVFESAGVGLLAPLLSSLEPDAEPFTTGWAWFDRVVLASEASPEARLYQVSALILVSILLRSVLGYAAQIQGLRATQAMLDGVRRRIHDQLSAVSLQFFSRSRTGDLVNTVTVETGRLNFLLGTAVQIPTEGFKLLSYVALAFLLSWELTVAAVVLLGVTSWVIRFIVDQVRRRSDELTAANAQLSAIVTEFIHGIRTVVAFGTVDYERARFHQASASVADHNVRTGARAALARPVSEMLAALVLIGIVVVSVRVFVFEGALSMGALLTFLFALFRIVPLVQQLNNTRANIASCSGSLRKIAALLDPRGKPYLSPGTRPAPPLREGVRLEDVTFAYDGGEPVLRDVSLTIPARQTVALVGASGSGKSTLANLVARFYDPTEGRVLYDGVDLREIRTDALRRRVSVVSQDTFLFNDTVVGNIAYGLPDVPRDRVVEAARQANALEFIEGLPLGFGTVLGERGVRLSGGQRQRLAIARAILRDPDLLILDEATSALDSVSERLVQESLEQLMEGRTVIVIAHRLSTVEQADVVAVLERGRVVEVGRYAELLARRGQLWEYHTTQRGGLYSDALVA